MRTPEICITKHYGGDWYVMIKNKDEATYIAYSIKKAYIADSEFDFEKFLNYHYSETLDLTTLLQKVVKGK